MEYVDSNPSADEDRADPQTPNSARKSNSASTSEPGPRSWPYTAIERQIAASVKREAGERAGAGHTRFRRRKADRRNSRWGFGSFLALLWLVVVGLIVIFTDLGGLLQRAVSIVPHAVEQQVVEPQVVEKNAERSATEIAPTDAVPASDTLSIPVADVSLRHRPELFEQLVQVYRAQLAAKPHDAATQTALERLYEHSLADIQSLMTEGYVATASRSLEIVSRLFPEFSDNVRYKYLVTRAEYLRRDVKEEAAPVSTPSAVSSSSVVSPSSVISAAPPVSTPPVVAASINVPSPVAKKNSQSVPVSAKPEIRSVSIMPGTMVEGRFVPGDGGNVFMVELSYSNFAKAFAGQNEATLVTLLGVPDDPLVLAEVPVTISGDRGTKSFAMETNAVQGYAGGKFQLNFMLNDEFLASRTLRLSRPR